MLDRLNLIDVLNKGAGAGRHPASVGLGAQEADHERRQGDHVVWGLGSSREGLPAAERLYISRGPYYSFYMCVLKKVGFLGHR